MKTLFVLNVPPYGTERSYNAVRLAGSLAKREGQEVRIFLLGDAASCAKAGQSVPQGYDNLERMIRAAVLKNALVGVCGTCMDARGLRDEELVECATRSTLEELADWTQWSERVLVFCPGRWAGKRSSIRRAMEPGTCPNWGGSSGVTSGACWTGFSDRSLAPAYSTPGAAWVSLRRSGGGGRAQV